MTIWSSWSKSTSVVVLCFLGIVVGGCGKKGPPRPPEQKKLPRVEDLRALVADVGVVLTWTITSGKGDVAGFNVYRSKSEPAISDCPGCTREFELLTTITVKAEQTQFKIVDQYIGGRGRFYYRVAPFDERDRPGPESNEATVLIE